MDIYRDGVQGYRLCGIGSPADVGNSARSPKLAVRSIKKAAASERCSSMENNMVDGEDDMHKGKEVLVMSLDIGGSMRYSLTSSAVLSWPESSSS